MPLSPLEAKLRKQIVGLMATRATLTAKKHAAEWRRIDRQITTLQRKVDRLRAQKG